MPLEFLRIEGIPNAADRSNIAAALAEFFAEGLNVHVYVSVSRNFCIAGVVVDHALRQLLAGVNPLWMNCQHSKNAILGVG